MRYTEPGPSFRIYGPEYSEADTIIAEMTGSNANVLYELGLCHAIDRKVIMITQDVSHVPSDLRHINCIVYDISRPNWSDQLRNAIQNMLLFEQEKSRRAILSPAASVDNTDLFDQLEQQVRQGTIRIREAEAELDELRDQAHALADERDRQRASLRAQLIPNLEMSKARISVSSEDGLTIATITLPTDDGTLEFISIPEGDFVFGGGASAERRWLPTYWITRFSVTNFQYCAFLNEIGLREEEGLPWIDLSGNSPADKCRIIREGDKLVVEKGYEDHPVTYVNYYGATAFCEWIGATLPSVEQWEKAARGTDGREYPWGASPANNEVANIQASGWVRDVAPINVRAKMQGASPFGMVQPIGNVWHWTSTYYPDRGVQAVRGGSFFDFRLGRREVYRFQVHPDGPDFSQGLVVAKRFLTGME